MIKILFVCIHNSARSQMAEAFLNKIGHGYFHAQSAGISPGKLNPVVVEAMREEGIDIAHNRAKSVEDFILKNERFDYVITVCDEASAERCPVVPGEGKRLHWGFRDPSSLEGSHAEKVAKTRLIRDEIKLKIKQWLSTHPHRGLEQ